MIESSAPHPAKKQHKHEKPIEQISATGLKSQTSLENIIPKQEQTEANVTTTFSEDVSQKEEVVSVITAPVSLDALTGKYDAENQNGYFQYNSKRQLVEISIKGKYFSSSYPIYKKHDNHIAVITSTVHAFEQFSGKLEFISDNSFQLTITSQKEDITFSDIFTKKE